MRAAVRGEDLIVEVFDTETETCDADVFECLEFCFVQRARLTLERYFLRVPPAHVSIETIDQIAQLFVADV